MTNQTGQCLCGSMKYEITGDPIRSVACHCTHCQKASGSAYSLNIIIASDQFSVSGGTLTTYTDKGDSGEDLRRHFCNRCGSPLYTEADSIPGMTIVKAGTLDDTTTFKPNANIFCSSRMGWLTQESEITDFDKMPHD